MKKINKLFRMLGLGMGCIVIWTCTNLDIEPTDRVFSNLTGEFAGVDPAASLEGLYNQVSRQMQTEANLYSLQEISSDEFILPTRGTDWSDNGVHRVLHSHTWDANHPFLKFVWNDQNQNIYNATAIIDPRSNPTPRQAAEAKFIRAFSFFWLADLFGQVPFRTPDEGPGINPRILKRTEALEFAINDLQEALPELSEGTTFDVLGRASKPAAQCLLAKFYLNKHIYFGHDVPNTTDMTEVIRLVDAIHSEGFELQEGYFNLFTVSEDTETIWFTSSDVSSMMWSTLHYNQNAPDQPGGGWNGFTTLADFFDSFEGDANINIPGSGQEERRGFVPTDGSHLGIGYGFLIGQQFDENGEPLTDRSGSPLIFSKVLPGLLGNDEKAGIRVIKYHPEHGSFVNHKIIFRYSDAHLMKAEAILRNGGDPTDLVNELRELRSAQPLSKVGENELLAERGRELYGEYWRRNDLIRFGKFTRPWALKELSGDVTKELFPIPATALISNPALIQNEGY